MDSSNSRSSQSQSNPQRGQQQGHSQSQYPNQQHPRNPNQQQYPSQQQYPNQQYPGQQYPSKQYPGQQQRSNQQYPNRQNPQQPQNPQQYEQANYRQQGQQYGQGQQQYGQGQQQYGQGQGQGQYGNYSQGQYSQQQGQYRQQGGRSDGSSNSWDNKSSSGSIQGLPSRSTYQSESFNQPAKNTLQPRFKLMPRQEEFSGIVKPTKRGLYLTNYYKYKQNHNERDTIYLYSVETRPTIPPDSHDLWYRLIRTVTKKLERLIGIITFRANTIWGKNKLERPYTLNTFLKGNRRGDQNQPATSSEQGHYQILIKMTKEIKLNDLYNSEESAARPLFVQMVNNSIKERMHELGYFELGKGRFYSSSDLQDQNCLKTQGLTIMNGFKFTFISLDLKRSYLQIDTCSRILRTENFYETLVNTAGSQAEKMQKFKGATLLARYGNHKTYTVQEIDFSRTPFDSFPIKQNGQQIQMTFAKYLEDSYGIKVTAANQPLIKAIAKIEKRIEKGKRLTKTPQAIFLIPEFMILTGMSDQQRENRPTMQQVAAYVKTDPIEKEKRISALSQRINNHQIRIEGMTPMEGYKLPIPEIQAQNKIEVNREGSFDFKDRIYEEQTFVKETWGFAYTNKIPEAQALQCLEILRSGGEIYGVYLEEPLFIRFESNGNVKERLDTVLRVYQEKTGKKLEFLVFLLTAGESATSFYNHVKAYCTRALRIRTQFVLASTLEHKREAAGGKVALQMAAKAGSKLWIVPQKHEHWQSRKVALASVSFSRGSRNGFTIALVGTTDNTQSSVCSYSMTNLSRKDQIAAQIFRNFFQQWLLSYYGNEGKMPDSLVIYREGLSDVQIKKTINDELESLFETIAALRISKKCPGWAPEVALFIVNKKVNSKFFDYHSNNPSQFYNPTSGSIIFCEMASHGQIDFYLVAQKVSEKVGTATPTQYKLIYYKPEGVGEESLQKEKSVNTSTNTSMEKRSLPLSALAQLTYEQCFNYDNWQGAIKIPAVLKYGDKMSTMVGEHVGANVNLVDASNECLKAVANVKDDHARLAAKNDLLKEWTSNILSQKWYL